MCCHKSSWTRYGPISSWTTFGSKSSWTRYGPRARQDRPQMLNYQYFYRFHHVSTHQDDKISSILLYLSFQITLKYVPGCLTNKYLSCTSSWPYGPTSFEHEQPDPPPLRPWPIFTTPTTKSCGRNSIDEHRTVIVKLPVIAFSDSDNEILKRWHRISVMMG